MLVFDKQIQILIVFYVWLCVVLRSSEVTIILLVVNWDFHVFYSLQKNKKKCYYTILVYEIFKETQTIQIGNTVS